MARGTHDWDLVVVGGGSGGVRAARLAAQRGARVALVEAAALGGTCVNVGCIPKKLYSYAAGYAQAFEEAAGYGWQLQPPVLDWERLKAARAQEIARLNGVYEQMLLAAGVRILRGWGSLAGAHQVRVQAEHGADTLEAAHILIATGGTPTRPGVPGEDLAVTSDAMFDLPRFPRRLVVLGGGYIACEFASIFQGLGAQVQLLHRGPQVLRGFDDEVRGFVAGELRKAGLDLRLDCRVQGLQAAGQAVQVQLHGGERLEADVVLLATGRAPNVAGLGLELAGVRQRADGAIEVDAQHRTSVPSVFAVGDVTARVQLTPVALGEAMDVVERLYGEGRRQMDYAWLPTAVFTHPGIGSVGLTEEQARARCGAVTVYTSEFRPLRHTVSGSSERCLVKLLVETATDRVVGLHMVGPEAGEIVQGFAVALRAGATKAQFDATLGIHPTIAEEFVTLRTPTRQHAPA